MRYFVAVLLGEKERETLTLAAREFCGHDPAFRLIAPENLHLTLQFLGELEPDRAAQVQHALQTSLASQPAFEIELFGCGAFPSTHQPRIVWVGIRDGALQFGALTETVRAALEPLGLQPDKPFSPHITVARAKGRVRRPPSLGISQSRSFARLRVDSVDLMQSTLSRNGARYTSLLHVRLVP